MAITALHGWIFSLFPSEETYYTF